MNGNLIGICGGSCSGKTTLVKGLKSKLSNLTLVHFDDFFIGKEKIGDRLITNWEDPNLYRLEEFESVLQKLKSGQEIEIESNSREAKIEGVSKRLLVPNIYIIVEGFLIFYLANFRNYFNKKIYLDIPEDEIIRRRFERMKNGGGKYSEEYIRKTLIEEHREVVLPQKKFADLIVDATKSPDKILNEVLAFISI